MQFCILISAELLFWAFLTLSLHSQGMKLILVEQPVSLLWTPLGPAAHLYSYVSIHNIQKYNLPETHSGHT